MGPQSLACLCACWWMETGASPSGSAGPWIVGSGRFIYMLITNLITSNCRISTPLSCSNLLFSYTLYLVAVELDLETSIVPNTLFLRTQALILKRAKPR
ncbi:hypothetical protein BDV32DRAFT_60964 [Aspergillus pseudonomiae]|uniref:Uncharacterized protein n=1 Tax=Aspergillus pseudonomiae TaxID=1506151 RepID=A0A5N6I1V7_9EURO|nr:uncharacterized protein BDV37DRAFT_52101 [Aspergillus pseudonomiae]KAB8259023.1 hypothetical protein BDV32DRAFT_60964 [Aspergillus pseudonomiae]KAE8406685.1 hypothetical protein BDV37DRAFT_52101 [Aspergillus pseudonomiae]